MLTPAQEKYCLLVAEGFSQAKAARECQKTPQTATAWMKNQEVTDRIKELREDLTSQAVVMLRENVLKNTQIILDIAKFGGEPGVVSSRLKAALWAVEKVLKPAQTAENKEEKMYQDLAKELELMNDEEAEELAERGRPTTLSAD